MRIASRRGFLKQTLGACWTGAALLEQAVFRAGHARASAPADPGNLFDIEKVADGIYAAVARPQELLNCNAAIFENSDGLLIVDTHSKPSAVASLVAQIRRDITAKPVRYIVNSHFHWDHTQGNGAYRRTAPSAQLISSETTRVLLSENGAARLKASREQAAKSAAEYRQKASASSTAEERQRYSGMAEQAEAYVAEMNNYAPELPNVTFSRDLVLHDRAHDLHLAFRGRAHTAGDVVVWCPQKKVIATGDMLHGFAPYIGDGYPKSWPATLREVGAFEFDRVIGGHGGVQQGKTRLQQTAAYLAELAELVDAGKKAGKTVGQLQKEHTPDKLRSIQGSYGEYLTGARRYLVAQPGVSDQEWLRAAVRSNIADVYSTIDKG